MYSKRFCTEETFRGVKDLRFGMDLSSARVKAPERRNRLLLVSALACPHLPLFGAAGESLGMERYLKTNTVKTRTYSLFNQGCMYSRKRSPSWGEGTLAPTLEVLSAEGLVALLEPGLRPQLH